MISFRINHKPLFTAAGAVYPYSSDLKKRFTFASRFGDKVELFSVEGDKIILPRECCPMGEDRRSLGAPVEFGPMLVGPRDAEQESLYKQSIDLLRKDVSHIMSARTGIGKTFIGTWIAQSIGLKTLIVIPKEDIKAQWRDALIKFAGLKARDIGYLQGDKCTVKGKKVVIGMVQSLCKDKYPDWVKEEFGFVIFDECVSGDALVTTDVGEVPLRELVGRVVSGEDICALSWNSEEKVFEYRRILAAESKGVRETITIEVEGHDDLVCTPDHKVMLTNGDWVEAGSLKEGDEIATYRERLFGTIRPYVVSSMRYKIDG